MKQKGNPWVSLIALLLLITVVVCVCAGCEGSFTAVERTRQYTVYRHNETGVHYFCKGTARGGKAICVMLNPDGTPYTGKEAIA